MSPLIFWQARRWPLERGKLLHHLLIYIGSLIVLHLISTPIMTALHWWMGFPLVERQPNLSSYIKAEVWHSYTGMLDFFVYWVVLIVGWGMDYQRKYLEGETRSAILATQLAEAQLQALKMQLQPHFLFNTLNSISALLLQDIEAADKMVARLGNFLRLTLESANSQMTTLKQELEFLRLYLDIEQVRFKDRLQVEFEVEPKTLDARIPTLILQPLVENAIRHGIARQYAQGKISVTTQINDGKLKVQVIDNGPGLTASYPLKDGVGLTNTRARLKQLYGEDYRLDLNNNDPQGLNVSLEIPLTFLSEAISNDKKRAAR